MADKMSFQQKLADIMKLAQENGMRMTAEETEQFFEDDGLTKEQMDLVFDYLLSQKVAVQGYVRKPGTVQESGDGEEMPGSDALSAEEKEYLEDYLRQIGELQATSEEEARLALYLRLVYEEAVKLHREEVFIGDMIQEGNAALVEAMDLHPAGEGEQELVMADVRAAMRALLASQTEMKRRDRKMVNQVTRLGETIKQMTDELGRKVDVQEVAERLELTEEQVRDILKLTGEEPEDEK
ncbi:sigma-70 domain-containing protein [Faecalicatena fissicatena]|uniref:RNA polymerase sigma-70 region 3 domain-containing protein n=1 Tax=Faecalicatena fissicatena TaxID=290055 RepID=A0ABS2E679_9FIRM|nr:sigma-70 domain-containing protein [Faecalicatena fissicatena]MBM6737114.1 hypothetical protein [Faecalicatena fissicatena]